MSRAFDFTVVAVVFIISVVIHLMAVELFAPGSPLYSVATSGTQTLNGQARADLWFRALAIWVPWISVAGVSLYALVREYRRQAVTAVSRTP